MKRNNQSCRYWLMITMAFTIPQMGCGGGLIDPIENHNQNSDDNTNLNQNVDEDDNLNLNDNSVAIDNQNSNDNDNGNENINSNDNSIPQPPAEARFDPIADFIAAPEDLIQLTATLQGPAPATIVWEPLGTNPVETIGFQTDEQNGTAIFYIPDEFILPPIYQLQFTATATYDNGATLTSDPVTITVM